jgi:thiol-disulfide isomerase/thioredoxin
MRALAMGIAILLTALNTFAGDLHWQTNWDEAFRIAKRERKMVFADFYADWCKPCRWMETSVFPHAYAAAKHRSHSRESYEKAKSVVPPDHAIARQADGAIARLH